MLLGIVPFGIITGVAMVASGIPPLVAMLMSVIVFAGASMVASAQLLASSAPALLIILTTLIINLRFMMYSASLRVHFADAPLARRLAIAYLTADNVYGLMLGRFAEHPADPGKFEYFLGAGLVVCGHSHVPFVTNDRGLALFNPGSVGPRRFALPIVFGVMEVTSAGVSLRHVDCETGLPWRPA